MRVPVGAIVPGAAVTIVTGSQFQGGANAANQLQEGSNLFFKQRTVQQWISAPLTFAGTVGNNKYYSATMPASTFEPGDVVEYYCRIPFSDRDTTFVHARDGASSTTAEEEKARAAPFRFTVADSALKGLWGPVFRLSNVAAHATVLKTGLVLLWGRRDRPDQSLDEQECTPLLWDATTNQETATPQPALANGTKVNLFCSGHAFLPDGRLLVVGGHRADSDGLDQAAIYDPATNRWTATQRMKNGRWYPTAMTLPDGSVLVLSGSYIRNGTIINNADPEVWTDGRWTTLARIPDNALDLYPRMHCARHGVVFICGPRAQTWSLDTSQGGRWRQVAQRINAQRDYAPSVAFDVDRVIYLGGGNQPRTREPTPATETINLGEGQVRWRAAEPMRFPRRQHNATILADGTVLVTGGTRGGGGMEPNSMGFNDLRPGQPVHIAELWDPATGRWSEMAAEQVDRCYHASAVLLPDGTVLSAGGGEYKPFGNVANEPQDSHRDAQVFFPPYLFKGPRPEITSAPAIVRYGDTFQVGTAHPENVGKVTWIGLSSVTHSLNMSQSISVLDFEAAAGGLSVSAPESPDVCPPGHYLLFFLSTRGVPSVASIIQIAVPVGDPVFAATEDRQMRLHMSSRPATDVFESRAAVVSAARGTAVIVGITGTCPYGLAACWGGASEALHSLEGVSAVDPIPDAGLSTATVFLEDDRLPPVDRWREQFERLVNGTYELRGVEVTLEGTIELRDGTLCLVTRGQPTPLELTPVEAASKVQWDSARRAPKALDLGEATAFARLAAEAEDLNGRQVTVTGPLQQDGAKYRLGIRGYTV